MHSTELSQKLLLVEESPAASSLDRFFSFKQLGDSGSKLIF